MQHLEIDFCRRERLIGKTKLALFSFKFQRWVIWLALFSHGSQKICFGREESRENCNESGWEHEEGTSSESGCGNILSRRAGIS